MESPKLCRYMNLPKFVSLLSRSALWFTRADTFEDKWEGLSRAVPYRRRNIHHDYGKLIQAHAKWRRTLRKRFFVNCWTMEKESIPMWKIYGSYDAGIAIQTSVEKFDQSVPFPKEFPAHTTGPVRYYNSLPKAAFDYRRNVEYSWKKEFEIILQKRSSFKFESEWRAVIVGSPSQSVKSIGMWIPVTNLNDLIECVFVSPLAPKWFLTDVTELAKMFKLEATPELSELARPRPKQSPGIRRSSRYKLKKQ